MGIERHSKNPCPSCGGHDWYCYFNNENPDVVESLPRATPLVDLSYKFGKWHLKGIRGGFKVGTSRIYDIDECVNCGAVLT